VITGCAHAGVVNTAKHAVDLLGGHVSLHAVMGGFTWVQMIMNISELQSQILRLCSRQFCCLDIALVGGRSLKLKDRCLKGLFRVQLGQNIPSKAYFIRSPFVRLFCTILV
jgi:hypothetical protein